MLLGGGSTDGQARLILYKSTDLENWVYQGNIELTGIDLELGYMYECPSYIEIDGKDVYSYINGTYTNGRTFSQ